MSYAATIFSVMNKDKWNPLSAEDQRIIQEINQEWIEKQGKPWNVLDAEARDFAIQKNMNMVTATPEEVEATAQKMKPLFDKYVKVAQEKGLPGQEDPNFCQEYNEASQMRPSAAPGAIDFPAEPAAGEPSEGPAAGDVIVKAFVNLVHRVGMYLHYLAQEGWW